MKKLIVVLTMLVCSIAFAEYTLEERIVESLAYSCDQYCEDYGVRMEFGDLKISQNSTDWKAELEFSIIQLSDESVSVKKCEVEGKVQKYLEDIIVEKLDECVASSI